MKVLIGCLVSLQLLEAKKTTGAVETKTGISYYQLPRTAVAPAKNAESKSH